MMICPVCGKELVWNASSVCCYDGHSFDLAKEGYVNLLRSSRSGDTMGDDKLSARSRRDFLNKGYYAPLKDALTDLFKDKSGTLLDICCGEGYYTSAIAENPNLRVYGFDLSKEMVRLAARRGGGRYFVANISAIPMADRSVDWATLLFAPFHEKEIHRVLKPGARLYTVVPSQRHLFELKHTLYEHPYLNDEQFPSADSLTLVSKTKVCAEIYLETPEDIEAVFHMTPYYFHTGKADREKLLGLKTLKTPIEFVIGEYVNG